MSIIDISLNKRKTFMNETEDIMKISWISWWIVSIIEVLSFISITLFLWNRSVDATGVTQTPELKWISIIIMGIVFLVPIIIQIAWLITNLILSQHYNNQSIR